MLLHFGLNKTKLWKKKDRLNTPTIPHGLIKSPKVGRHQSCQTNQRSDQETANSISIEEIALIVQTVVSTTRTQSIKEEKEKVDLKVEENLKENLEGKETEHPLQILT